MFCLNFFFLLLQAQGKDFGLIATDVGYNLYVCGNGGSKPKHAVLLAKDVSEETAVKYIDRFLMYYIHTADRLMRTARWLEKLEGGIEVSIFFLYTKCGG